MKRASITQAKNGLSALLDRVRHGETILIEDRGTVVAQIASVAVDGSAADADAIGRLQRKGILNPPASTGPVAVLSDPPPRPSRAIALSRLVAAGGEGEL
ncbi:MAG: type II toxin-antitoxin system Phd/YefM family antitoxin [Vicinamibacterales bacterium]